MDGCHWPAKNLFSLSISYASFSIDLMHLDTDIACTMYIFCVMVGFWAWSSCFCFQENYNTLLKKRSNFDFISFRFCGSMQISSFRFASLTWENFVLRY